MESPKARFLKNDLAVKKTAALLHSIEFEQACDVAMLEFMHRQPQVADSPVADALRAQGARLYREVLENLADAAVAREPSRPADLNYNLK